MEPFVVLPVAALHLPVVPGGKGSNQLVPDSVPFQAYLEEGGLVPVGGEAVGELRPVVRLDALNGQGKDLHQVVQERGGGMGAVLLKGLHETPPRKLVDGGMLEEVLPDDLAVDEAGRRDELHIHLDALAGTLHPFVRLGDVLGVGRVDSHDALALEETVKAGDGTGIAALHELDPEHHEPCVRVPPTHVLDQLDLFRGMLVGVVVGPAREVTQGFDGLSCYSISLVSDIRSLTTEEHTPSCIWVPVNASLLAVRHPSGLNFT